MTTSYVEKPASQHEVVFEKGYLPVLVEYGGEWWTVYRAGRFDDRHPDVNPETIRFPLGPNGVSRSPVDIYLGYFKQAVETNEVLVEFDRQGYRPANLPELLAIAAEFPSFQIQFSIVALEAFGKNSNGDAGVAYLGKRVDCGETKRILGWGLIEKFDSWKPGVRFAVVKK